MSSSRKPSTNTGSSIPKPKDSQHSSSRGTSNKPKSLQTPGEEFFQFLKSLGYQPNPEHDKPEHFEYLFREEKSAKLMKALMQIKNPQSHVLTKDELER